jgi:hypothetical protein
VAVELLHTDCDVGCVEIDGAEPIVNAASLDVTGEPQPLTTT